MTSKLTREQLHERARENVKALKMASRQTAFESAREEILADLQLAELALAAMDSEPVAEVLSNRPGNDTSTIDRALPVGTQLYRHAQPAPVVPDEVTAEDCPALVKYDVTEVDEAWARGFNSYRAAMLQAGDAVRDLSTPVDPQVAEYEQNVMQAGNSPVIGIGLASGQDRTVEVRYVAPPGYVTVPREPTAEMILSAMRDNETGEVAEIYELMLAAAPQSPGSEPATVPGKWIPVSEQMPEREIDVQVYCPDKKEQMVAYLERNELEGYFRFATWRTGDGIYCQPTHWMQLPAAPQEGK